MKSTLATLVDNVSLVVVSLQQRKIVGFSTFRSVCMTFFDKFGASSFVDTASGNCEHQQAERLALAFLTIVL
jgi:hypothetical protein